MGTLDDVQGYDRHLQRELEKLPDQLVDGVGVNHVAELSPFRLC